jgi:hypothetical protein
MSETNQKCEIQSIETRGSQTRFPMRSRRYFAGAALVLVASSLLGGCSGRTLLYGADSCGGDLAAYVYTTGKSATCLPMQQTAYLLCVRELSLSERSDSSTREGGGQLGLTVSGVGADAGANVKLAEAAASKWTNEGDLAKARAKAIDACIGILDKPVLKAEDKDNKLSK